MADIVLLFILKGRDCMSKVLIEVLVIILIAGSYLILYSTVRVCYEVSDITAKVEQLKERKFIVVKNREKACAIDNREVVFMYSKHN